LGFRYFAEQSVGKIAFLLGSTSPFLPSPGIPISDANIVVDLTDPLAATLAALRGGAIVTWATPFAGGAFDSTQLPIPGVVAGLTLRLQGIDVDVASATLHGSPGVELRILP